MTTQSRLLLAAAALLAVGGGALLWRRATASPPASRLFVSNYKDDTVSVVDTALDREIKILPVGDSPFGITVCRGATPMVAVANSTARTVTLIDARSLEIVGKVATGKGPEFVACSADGTRLYVTSPYDLTVTVIDVAQRAPLGEPIKLALKPGPITLSPDGGRLYVVLRDAQGLVQAINTASRAVEASAPVGKYPTDVAVSRDGSHVLAPSFDDSTVTVIDAASFKVLGVYPAETGTGLLLHPDRPLAYSMAGMEGIITVLDYQAGKEVAAIECGEWPTHSAMTSDGRFLYVVNEESDNVVKIDTETNKSVTRIAVGNEPSDAVVVDFSS